MSSGSLRQWLQWGMGDAENLADFPDRWNPMFVRELRRMLKSRSFSITFLLLLITCWGAAVYLVLTYQDSISYSESGPMFSRCFFTILAFPLCFVVPMTLFAAAAEEHSDNTLEVLTITTLDTSKILNGYFWMGMAHAGIYYCAVVPFACFSYLLGGVGLLDLVASLGFTVFFTAIVACWGLMLGACASGPIKRAFCSFLTIGGGVICFTILTSVLFLLIGTGIFSSDSISLLGGLVCFLVFTAPILAIVTGIARQQFQLVDPIIKPYRVQLDDQGNVTKFIARYNALQVRPPLPSGEFPMAAPRTNETS